jgi:hypothetical protein
MKKIDLKILKVFLLGLPIVLFLAIATNVIENLRTHEFMNSLSGLFFGVWMALALYLSIRLIFSNELRSNVLARMSLFKERDERESAVTAAATRNSFLTTLAVLIFLLCLSLFQVAVYKLPPEQALNGKTGTISLGLYFSPINSTEIGTEKSSKLDYFRYTGLPFSNSAVTLIIIIWLIGSFNYFARRELNKSKS